MANLKITYSALYTRISNFIGLTSTGTAPTGTDLTTCTDIAERGIRRFLYPIDQRTGGPHEWSFLKPLYTINLVSSKWKYQLPADFSEIITDPTYKKDEGFKQIEKITPDEILNLRAAGVVNYAPYYYAIVDTSYDPEIGEFTDMWFYPEPDSSYPIQFFYHADPTKPSGASDFLPGGVKAIEAIIENCLSVAEAQEEDKAGIHTALAGKLTQELIIVDSQRNSNERIGNMYASEDRLFMLRDQAGLTVYGTTLS